MDLDERREYRRKRRMRNQLIVYGVSLIVVAVLAAGVVFGTGVILERLEAKRQEEQLAAQLEALSQEEQAVITPPVSAEEVGDGEMSAEGGTEETDWLEELVTDTLAEIPLEDKVAGLFLTTPEAITGVGKAIQAGKGTGDALEKYAVGGLIYRTQNIKSREQLTEMLSNTRSMSKYPLFLGIEEEGGAAGGVAASSMDVTETESMWNVGQSGDASLAYQTGTEIGMYLKELGFDLNLAPSADLTEDPQSARIGKSSYGADPEQAGVMAASAVSGMQDAGISACLKHFPGVGDVTQDTGKEMAVLDKSMEQLQTGELAAFRQGITAGVDFVMVSHISLPQVLGDQMPCSLSEQMVTNVLRGELGYQGIVITDAMNQGAITQYYSAGDAAVMALKAGCDMVFVPEKFEETYQAVLEAVKEGIIAQERVEESLKKIYRVKLRDQVE